MRILLLLGRLDSLTRMSLFDQVIWSLLAAGKSAGVACLGWLLVRRLRAGRNGICTREGRA